MTVQQKLSEQSDGLLATGRYRHGLGDGDLLSRYREIWSDTGIEIRPARVYGVHGFCLDADRGNHWPGPGVGDGLRMH